MTQTTWMREGVILLVVAAGVLLVWQALPTTADDGMVQLLVGRLREISIAAGVLVYCYIRSLFNDPRLVLRGYAFWVGGMMIGATLIIVSNVVGYLSSVPAVLLFPFLQSVCEMGTTPACLELSAKSKEIIVSYLFSMSTFLVAVPVTLLFAFRAGHWMSRVVEPKPVMALVVMGLTYFAISRAAAELASAEIVEYTLELNSFSRLEAVMYMLSFTSAYIVAASVGYMMGTLAHARIAGEAARLIGGLSAYERAATLKDLRTRVRR
jgi:hypothetical protein